MARGNVPVAPTPGLEPRLSKDEVVAILTVLAESSEWGEDYIPEGSQEDAQAVSSTREVSWKRVCEASDRNVFAFAEVAGEEYALIVASYRAYIDYDSSFPQVWAVFSIEGFPGQFWKATPESRDSDVDYETFQSAPDQICEVYERVVVNVEYIAAQGPPVVAQ